MYKLSIFNSQHGWVSFGLHKTYKDAERIACNIKRFGNGFYHDVKIVKMSRFKYICDIIKMNIDNLF